MKIVALKNIEKNKVQMEGAQGAWKQLPLGSSDGTPLYSFRVFTVEPGGNTPYHSHPYEHMNYVIEGHGVLIDKEGNKHPLKEGDFALVEPGETHQYKNDSPDKLFMMICGVPKDYE